MNVKITGTKFDKTLDELASQTKCEAKFNRNDIKHLHNNIHTERDLKIFTDYFNIFKNWYKPSLIVKTFIIYGQAIERIIFLHGKLREYGITSVVDKLHAKSLFELQKLIITDNDWDDFYEFWNQRKKELLLETVLRKYRVARKKCGAS